MKKIFLNSFLTFFLFSNFSFAFAEEKINNCANYNEISRHVHLVQITLKCDKNIRIIGTPIAAKGMTTSEFAKLTNATIAINGGYFREGFFPFGLTVTDGKVWPKARDLKSRVFLGCGLKNDCQIEDFDKVSIIDPNLNTVVSGWQAMYNGDFQCSAPVDARCMGSKFTMKHPRTAVGISDDRSTLYVVVVEGRLKNFAGYNLQDLSLLFKKLNVKNAINMDGGGSTTLVINGRRVNQLPDEQPQERVVANHLGFSF